MQRKIRLIVGLVICAFLIDFFISGITRKDIIAANDFSFAVQAEPLTAGDIVVLPKDGKLSRLCNAVVAPGQLETIPRSDIYFNRAQSTLGWSIALAERVGLMPRNGGENVLPGRKMTFIGNASSLLSQEYTYQNPETCECAMARALSVGEKVCSVSASLIETRETKVDEDGAIVGYPVHRSLAVVLRRHVMYVGPEVFESCGIPHTDKARIVGQQLCSDGNALPVDVRLRKMLNLIDREPLISTQVSLIQPIGAD